MIDWPIFVDEDERDRLAALAISRPSRVQLIRGPSGIGKSTLAAAVGDALERSGYAVLRVMGMPELLNVPLGAMAPLLASTGASLDEPVTDRLHRLFSRASPANAKLVLIVDDGPLLDEISASTIYQLVRVYGLPAIMTARTEHPLGGPIARLVAEGALDTTELSGIPSPVASGLVLSALGQVEPHSVDTLVELAAGNPLFLRELVLAADRGAAVTRGTRGLIVDASALPAQLRDTIAVRFDSLSEPERRLAELVALGEPWPEPLLAAPRLLAALDRAGLLNRSTTGEISLSHPLFAETLIALMSDDELGEARLNAASRLATSPRDDHRFRAISLLAVTESEPSPAELAWAASYSHQADDQTRAIELATQSIERSRALDEAPQFGVLVVLADALAVAGNYDAAEDTFAVATAAAASDEETATVITRRGFYLAVRRQRPAEAVRLGAAAVEAMAPSAHREYLVGNLAKWRLMLGEKPTEPPAESQSELSVFNGQLFTLMAAIFASDLDSARDALAFVRPRAEAVRSVVRHGTQMIDFGDFFITALDGHVDEAIDFALSVRGGPRDESTGMWNYGLALFALQQGRMHDALSLVTLAVDQLDWRDFLGVRGPAIALLAIANARLGLPADHLDPELRENVVTDLHAAEAEAWLLAAQGNIAGALSAISAAVSRGIDGRCYAIAALTAYAAVRLGRADGVIESLRALASTTRGGLVHLIARHAEALVARDATALLDAGSRLAAAGLTAGALDASRQAAEIARESGQNRLARRAILLASSWAGGLGEDAREGGLSEREWDIARSAAGRERSREIAERLGLSVRTIDNHLTNIYKKLGVSGRDELRAELDELDSV